MYVYMYTHMHHVTWSFIFMQVHYVHMYIYTYTHMYTCRMVLYIRADTQNTYLFNKYVCAHIYIYVYMSCFYIRAYTVMIVLTHVYSIYGV